jgi:NADH-quinone oxidoreductase subunit C
MSERKDIISNVINQAEASGLKEVLNSSPMCFEVSAASLLSVCTHLHENPETYFDMLSCITGVDNGTESATMEVIYHLYSIPYNVSLALKVIIPRNNPEIESITSIWKSANWLEREVYDMFGITFKKHPDLRRILLPADWKGYPLRKDYKHEEYYRGVKIEY